MSDTLKLAQQLLQIESVTPNDNGCQPLIADYLQPLGFDIEAMPFGEVSNLWARRGTEAPFIVFAGHTDVVPTGPTDKWTHPPFSAHIDEEGMLNARGAADMKARLPALWSPPNVLLNNTQMQKARSVFNHQR